MSLWIVPTTATGAWLPTTSCGSPTPARSLVTNRSSLVGYWRMDALSGTTELDQSAGGHNGTYSSSPTLAERGALIDGDTAIKCASVGKMTVSSAVFTTAAFSITAWVQFTATDVTQMTANEVFLATQQTFPVSGWRFGAHKFGGDVANHFAFWCTQEGGTLKVESVEIPVAGQWYHAAVTFDGTTTTIYVNGAFSASGTGTRVDDTSSVMFGHISSTQSLDGWLDDCAMYNTALTAAQVAAEYRVGSGGPGIWGPNL